MHLTYSIFQKPIKNSTRLRTEYILFNGEESVEDPLILNELGKNPSTSPPYKSYDVAKDPPGSPNYTYSYIFSKHLYKRKGDPDAI